MLHFVVAVPKSRWRRKSPKVDALLQSSVCDTLPGAAGHTYWSSQRSRVSFAGWTDESSLPWKVDAERLVAVAGQPVFIDGRSMDRAQRLEWLARPSTELAHDLANAHGPFAVVRIDAGGSGEIILDPFSIHNVYRGETARTTYFSNKTTLIAAAIEVETGLRPDADPAALAIVTTIGHMVGEMTGYSGIECLPFGHGVTIGGRRASVTKTRSDPWEVDIRPEGPTGETLDELEARVVAFIHETIDRFDEHPMAELTAGRDSRLVLAMLAQARVLDRVTFFTRGGESTPDFEGAVEMANRLDLDFTRTWWPVPLDGFVDYYERHVARVAGQLGAWESSERRGMAGPTFSGLFGETLRAAFPRLSGLGDVDRIRSNYERTARGRAGPLRGHVLEQAIETLVLHLLAPLDEGYPPEVLGDIFYVKHRMRRWLGAQNERHIDHFYPLYVDGLAREAFRWGPAARVEDRLRIALMERADLGLDDLGFGKPDKSAKVTKTKQSGRHPAAKLGDGAGLTMAKSRAASDMSTREDAIASIFSQAQASPGFDIVDSDAFAEMLTNYDELTTMERIRLHWALTPIVWMR